MEPPKWRRHVPSWQLTVLTFGGDRENGERWGSSLHLASQTLDFSSLQGKGPEQHLVLFPHDVLHVFQRRLGFCRDRVDPRCRINQIRLRGLDPIPYRNLPLASSAVPQMIGRHRLAPLPLHRITRRKRYLPKNLEPFALKVDRDGDGLIGHQHQRPYSPSGQREAEGNPRNEQV